MTYNFYGVEIIIEPDNTIGQTFGISKEREIELLAQFNKIYQRILSDETAMVSDLIYAYFRTCVNEKELMVALFYAGGADTMIRLKEILNNSHNGNEIIP